MIGGGQSAPSPIESTGIETVAEALRLSEGFTTTEIDGDVLIQGYLKEW